MRVYVKRNKRLDLVATTKLERNLLKHFRNKEPYIVRFSTEIVGVDNEETEVKLTLSFRTLAKPQEQTSLKMKDHQEDLE